MASGGSSVCAYCERVPPGLSLNASATGCTVDILVAPRARHSQVLGVHDGALKVAIKASPVDGAANQELVRFLAKALGVTKRDVQLLRGHTSRRKQVRIEGEDIAPRVRALLT